MSSAVMKPDPVLMIAEKQSITMAWSREGSYIPEATWTIFTQTHPI